MVDYLRCLTVGFPTATPMLHDLTVGLITGMTETASTSLCGETEFPHREEGLAAARMGPPRTGLRLQCVSGKWMVQGKCGGGGQDWAQSKGVYSSHHRISLLSCLLHSQVSILSPEDQCLRTAGSNRSRRDWQAYKEGEASKGKHYHWLGGGGSNSWVPPFGSSYVVGVGVS